MPKNIMKKMAKIHKNYYQQTPMDSMMPSHSIALYTTLGVQCDQQMTIVVTVDHSWPCLVSSPGVVNTKTHNCRLFAHTCIVSV